MNSLAAEEYSSNTSLLVQVAGIVAGGVMARLVGDLLENGRLWWCGLYVECGSGSF